MKNQSIYRQISYGLSLFLGLLLFYQCQPGLPEPPAPTTGKVNMDATEDEKNAELKERWLALMHQSAPDVDWRRIEFQNRLARHEKRSNQRHLRSSGQDILANGQLVGEWSERGSNNNAGSVLATEYDADNDKIYLISAGGTVWRGTPHNEDWTPLNDDFQFQARFLKRIILPDGTPRLLALSGGIPMYSDDEGLNWTATDGLTLRGNGSSDRAMMMRDSSHQIYLLSKRDYWSNLQLYTSTDLGASFRSVKLFNSINYNSFALLQPNHSTDFFLVEKNGAGEAIFHKRNNQGTLEALPTSTFGFGQARANLQGYYDMNLDKTVFFAYAQNTDNNGIRTSELYRSEDEGASWTKLSDLPENPWQVGVYLSPSNPDFLLMGGVECFRSADGGSSWERINEWVEYYDDIVTKLHADMMVFNEFETTDGVTFQLISNHGGLNISYNEVKDVRNIGMKSLNVGQFYDVQTDRLDPNWIYGGTQDQGLQRGASNSANPTATIDMEQVWSGDYGHMAFTANNTALWTVYPGGLIYRYNDPKNDPYPFSAYTIDSDNESVWIPPLIADPDPSRDITYLAGGNPDGRAGSFLVKLSHSPWQIAAEKHSNFDFYAESGGGEVSALAYSKINTDLWYAATTNGRFFYSTDRGYNWEQTLEFVPGGQYLYGASIFPSPLEENTIYFAGSGYSNPGVLVSRDGGATFLPMTEGLPPTLVIELAGDPDGNYLFAATESGPFVYSFDQQRWFDMAGIGAPAQTYWSVEYLADQQKVRFGTYGRGIWDFDIQELNVSTSNTLSKEINFTLSPNPSQGLVVLDYPKAKGSQIDLRVVDGSGRLVATQQIAVNPGGAIRQELDYRKLSSGTYFLIVEDANDVFQQKLVISH